MRILSKMAVLAAVAMLAGACCPCRSYQKKTRRPLTGTEWQLVQLNGRSVQPEAGRFTITLQADESQISGTGACNRIFGPYVEGEKRALKIGPLASTKMMCPADAALCLPLRRGTDEVRLPSRWFFPSGEAERWSGARFAALRCTNGACFLEALLDEERRPLNSDGRTKP